MIIIPREARPKASRSGVYNFVPQFCNFVPFVFLFDVRLCMHVVFSKTSMVWILRWIYLRSEPYCLFISRIISRLFISRILKKIFFGLIIS